MDRQSNFLSHYGLLEATKSVFCFCFCFNLQSLCGSSWTNKCLCWVIAFIIALSSPCFLGNSGDLTGQHPTEPGLGMGHLLLVSGLLPPSHVMLAPCDLESSYLVAGCWWWRTVILFLSAGQTVLLVSIFFADEEVNAVTTCPESLRFVHLEQHPFQQGQKRRRAYDVPLHRRLLLPLPQVLA